MSGLKIIRQNYAGLVETLGKYSRTVKSGVVFVFPFFQKVRRVSLALQPQTISRYSKVPHIVNILLSILLYCKIG